MLHQRRLPSSWFALDPKYSIVALKVFPIPPLPELECFKKPVTRVLMSWGYVVLTIIDVGEAKRTQACYFNQFCIITSEQSQPDLISFSCC